MTCRKVGPLIDDFADGALDLALSDKIQEHISNCSKCGSNFNDARRLKNLLSSLIRPEPDGQYFRHVTDLILTRVFVESQVQRRVH